MLKKTLRIIMVGIAAITLIIGSAILLRSGPRPMCHRNLDGAFQQWMIETAHTNVFPNVDGNGSNSLAQIAPYCGEDIQKYGYIPGLTVDDPDNLILMYMRTRYTWHGDNSHTLFSQPRWLILSPKIAGGGTFPEGGEFLDMPEFKERLQMTIAFLKEQERPHWEIVATAQSNFLNSINE